MATQELTFPRLITYSYPTSTRNFAPVKAYSQPELDRLIADLHQHNAINIEHKAEVLADDQYAKYDTDTLIGLLQMAESGGFTDDVEKWNRELRKPDRPKEN